MFKPSLKEDSLFAKTNCKVSCLSSTLVSIEITFTPMDSLHTQLKALATQSQTGTLPERVCLAVVVRNGRDFQ